MLYQKCNFNGESETDMWNHYGKYVLIGGYTPQEGLQIEKQSSEYPPTK